MPLEALYPTISEQIVPPMAVAEAQGVIFYFLIIDLESTVKNIELFDLSLPVISKRLHSYLQIQLLWKP